MEIKDLGLLLLAVILFFGIAYLISQYGILLSHPTDEPTPEEIYLSFLDNPQDEYYAVYEVNNDGFTSTLVLSKKEEIIYTKYYNPLYSKELYYSPETSLICIDFNSKKMCAVPVNSSELLDELSLMKKDHPIKENFDQTKEYNTPLIEKGALFFSDETEKKTFGEYTCNSIKYTIDYTKLSIQDLYALNISETQIQVFSPFNLELCFGTNNQKVFDSINYSILGVEKYYYSTLINYSTSSETIIFPEANTNESELTTLLNDLSSAMKNAYDCVYSEDIDSCFRDKALSANNEAYCELSGSKRDNCLSIIGFKKLDVNICSKISESEIKDGCYLQVAAKLNDSTICSLISNPEILSNCTNLIQ
ncbi:MAG: hypothetical protein PHU63_03130 [Candidatus ainarchaeum sp.]|nr:hypothetical protein [Candidatus ainarchaeum sp.]